MIGLPRRPPLVVAVAQALYCPISTVRRDAKADARGACLPGRRKRLMLDRSLQIEFDSYRKTLSTPDRLTFDECIERLLSQHGIDYVRGYVDALKERGSR